MAILHRAGYRAIELEDWIKALLRDEPLFGRPMVLTFDDGYRDFLTAATPVLRLFGFPATVFLVAGRMGGMSDWDASYGDPAPLLSWEEVHALRDVGIGFGCHSLVHQLMTGMPLRELAESTSRARGILEEGLASLVTTLAYPHGAENEFVRRVIGDLGFQAAVTCEEGISRLGDDPLRLRRVEVTGACTPEQLLRLLDADRPDRGTGHREGRSINGA
jgi:peptidoglycan/xylan/chitin deacetylase (PgdA/CDA1 family)